MTKYSVDATIFVIQPEENLISLQDVLALDQDENLHIRVGEYAEDCWPEGYLDVIFNTEQASVQAAEDHVEQKLLAVKLPDGLIVKQRWLYGSYNDDGGFWETEY